MGNLTFHSSLQLGASTLEDRIEFKRGFEYMCNNISSMSVDEIFYLVSLNKTIFQNNSLYADILTNCCPSYLESFGFVNSLFFHLCSNTRSYEHLDNDPEFLLRYKSYPHVKKATDSVTTFYVIPNKNFALCEDSIRVGIRSKSTWVSSFIQGHAELLQRQELSREISKEIAQNAQFRITEYSNLDEVVSLHNQLKIIHPNTLKRMLASSSFAEVIEILYNRIIEVVEIYPNTEYLRGYIDTYKQLKNISKLIPKDREV